MRTKSNLFTPNDFTFSTKGFGVFPTESLNVYIIAGETALVVNSAKHFVAVLLSLKNK